MCVCVCVCVCLCVYVGRIDGTPEGQVAIIARMNITLFQEMVKTVRSGKSLRLGFAGVGAPYCHSYSVSLRSCLTS